MLINFIIGNENFDNGSCRLASTWVRPCSWPPLIPLVGTNPGRRLRSMGPEAPRVHGNPVVVNAGINLTPVCGQWMTWTLDAANGTLFQLSGQRKVGSVMANAIAFIRVRQGAPLRRLWMATTADRRSQYEAVWAEGRFDLVDRDVIRDHYRVSLPTWNYAAAAEDKVWALFGDHVLSEATEPEALIEYRETRNLEDEDPVRVARRRQRRALDLEG